MQVDRPIAVVLPTLSLPIGTDTRTSAPSVRRGSGADDVA
jgi:hypothetical protein